MLNITEFKNRNLIALIACAITIGCTPSKPTNTRPLETAIEIQTNLEVIAEDTLNVTFVLPNPAKALYFNRTPDAQRITRWVSLDDNILLEHKDGVDVISKDDGHSFTTASFNVPMTYTTLPKDYAPFMPYRDNGVLIHSGRFQVCFKICDDDDDATAFPMSIAFPKSEQLVLLGKNLSASTSWNDTQNGTMIYVGRSKPIKTDYVLSIVDSLLPEDIGEPLAELFPQLMAYYAERLGQLHQKPMLFASFDRYAKPDGNPNSNSFSSQGGTLPGQVFMHFTGDAWFEEESVRGQETTGGLLWFFAHEAGHLYQLAAEYSQSDSDAWIHEGGADAFAALALLELKAASPGYVEDRITETIEVCLKGLSKGRLDTASERGDFNLLYSCGMVIQLAADKAMRERSGGQSDLFNLWALFLKDVKSGKQWNQKTFLDLIETHAGIETLDLAISIISAEPNLTLKSLETAVQ